MGCGASKPTVSRVLVIGGGYGGAYLTHLLQKEGFCEVTLIEPDESMVHHIAISRCIVEPEFLKKTFIPYGDFVKNFVREIATEINTKKRTVVLNNGKKVRYDYLVIALDQSTSFPRRLNHAQPGKSILEAESLYKAFTEEEFIVSTYKLNTVVYKNNGVSNLTYLSTTSRPAKPMQERNPINEPNPRNSMFKMKKAPEIVFLGGNQFAVETAGEIRADYPDKKVTILHGGTRLLGDSTPPELQASLMEILDRKEVDVILDDHVTNLKSVKLNQFMAGQIVETKNGRKVPGDLVVSCGEESTMPQLIDVSFPELLQKQGGKLPVDDFMRVLHCVNTYAIGGVTNSEIDPFEENEQAKVVLQNLKHDITMEGNNVMFQQNKKSVMITIGRYGGVGFANGKLLDEDEIMEKKSEDLFTKMLWENLGLTYNR